MMDKSRELATASITAKPIEGLAIKASIFLAVLLLGTYIFSQHILFQAQVRDRENRTGYHLELRGVKQELVQELEKYVPKHLTYRQELMGNDESDAPVYRLEVTYKNIRDCYSNCRKFLQSLGEEESVWLEGNKLLYNTGLLESHGVFQDGFTPSSEWISNDAVKLFPLILLFFFFVSMISSAFSQWQSQKWKELALLQSVGMDKSQLRYFCFWRSYYLSRGPIIGGSIISYILAVLIELFKWRTIQKGFQIYSWEYERNYDSLWPSPWPFLILWALSALCIAVATLRSAKSIETLTVVEALRSPIKSGLNRKKESRLFTFLGEEKIQQIKGFRAGLSDRFAFLKIKKMRPEASLAKLFRSFYGRKDKKILLFLAACSIFVSVFLLQYAYSSLEEGGVDSEKKHEMNLVFWHKEELPEDLEIKLGILEKKNNVQITKSEHEDIKYVEFSAQGTTGRDISFIENKIREQVQQYFGKEHWVGLGSLKDNLLNQASEQSASLRLKMWFGVTLLLGAIYLFQHIFNELTSRYTDFRLLESVGMTEAQVRNMLYREVFIIMLNMIWIVCLELLFFSFLFSFWSGWEYRPWQLLKKINLFDFLVYIASLAFSLVLAVQIALRKMLADKGKIKYRPEGF